MFEGFDRVRLLFACALHVDKHAGMLHVRLNADFAGDHHAFQPRVLQLPSEHGVDFVCDLFSHAFVAVIGWPHERP